MRELMKTYPKSAEYIKEWFTMQFMNSLKEDVPNNFKEYVKSLSIDEEQIIKMLDSQPRALFDAFDMQEIYISIITLYPENDLLFSASINGVSIGMACSTRKEAEKLAIEKAFNLLNEKLCMTES
jgi:hypothetical protein